MIQNANQSSEEFLFINFYFTLYSVAENGRVMSGHDQYCFILRTSESFSSAEDKKLDSRRFFFDSPPSMHRVSHALPGSKP